MKSAQYLYGDLFDGKVLQELTYPQALTRKTIWARQLVDDLLSVHHSERDSRRIKKVCDAIKFNQALYDECYGLGKDIE